ncbi:MAG: PD-(D/E)XK nuclease-like domain-containing protein [Lutibacter sp.]|jgi:hypothetical protein
MTDLKQMNDVDYFASEGLSQSFLKAFDKSPAYAFGERTITQSMKDGKLLHALLLEPEKISERDLIIEKINRNTNVYKDMVKSNPDKEILFFEEIEDLYKMRDNILKLKYDFMDMDEIILKSKKEIACFAEIAGFQSKGKFDLLYEDRPIIFDIKLTSNIELFKWQVKDFGYYRQADWYKTLYSHYSGIPYEEIPFIIIASESQFPFGAKTIELTDEYIHKGSIENLESVKMYSKWLERGADKTEIYLETHEVIGV